MRSGLLALAAIVAMTTAAMADCRLIGGRFSLSQNHAVTTTGVSTKGATCGMKFASPANGHFDSIAVVARPSHGALREFGGMSYLYKPTPRIQGRRYLQLASLRQGRRRGRLRDGHLQHHGRIASPMRCGVPAGGHDFVAT